MGAYGWRPSPPDHRDRLFHLEEHIYRGYQLPKKVDLYPHVPPIWNQGELGSCTAHGSLRAYMTEAIKQDLNLPMLSRLLQYWNTRLLEGTTSYDAGGTVRDAIKALATLGDVPETEWPYDVAKFAYPPTYTVQADAKKHLAIKYQRVVVGGLGAPIRTALSKGLAIVFGFSVPESFEDGSWEPATGTPLPLPDPSEGFVGGHCVAITGYDWTGHTPFFTCDNSWGPSFGMRGRFNMDASWFNGSYGLATDLWVISATT